MAREFLALPVHASGPHPVRCPRETRAVPAILTALYIQYSGSQVSDVSRPRGADRSNGAHLGTAHGVTAQSRLAARNGNDDQYKWVVLSNTTLGSLMAMLDTSIMLIALPDIFRGIHT